MVIEPEEGALASRGEHGVGRLPAPERLLAGRGGRARRRRPVGRPAGAGHRRRHPRADRSGPLHRQPLQRPHGPRARRARPRRGAQVTLVAANVALPARRREPGRRRDAPPSSPRRWVGVPTPDLLLMAAAPADFRPLRAAGEKIAARAPTASSSASSRPRTSSPARPRRRDGQTLVGFAAEHGAGAIDRRGRSSSARPSTRSSSTTSRAPTSASTRRNEVTIVERAGRAPGPARPEGGGRRGDPRPGRGAAPRAGDGPPATWA